MDEISMALKRFGDEQSSLLDQFERLSFEIQLNQAILGRSLSEPGGVYGTRFMKPPKGLVVEPPLGEKVKQEKRKKSGGGGFGFEKVLKKLLKPMFLGKSRKVKKNDREVDESEKDKECRFYWKNFSRSLRI